MRKNDILITDILLSLVLLTRLPLPHLNKTDFARQSKAVWAFPVAGFAVALAACLAVSVAVWAGLSPAISAGIAIGVQILLTGAMHEDGLADTADGFWGGFERVRRLEIMKDSQIGTYGVLSLILGIGLRWTALSTLIAGPGIWVLVPLAMLSRSMMPVVMTALPNARGHGLSQSVGRPQKAPAVIGVLSALFVGLFVAGWATWLVLLVMAIATGGIVALAKRKIGGQTGDVLGATQQISEIAGLLALVAICS